MRASQRGSVLLTSVIIILVITVIGVGIIRFSSREVAGATAGGHEQSLVACADAARKLLMSKFRALGFQPSSIQALNMQMGGTGQSFAIGGHYDADTTNPQNIVISQVTYLPDNAFGPTRTVRDLRGIVPLVGQGGKPMKVVVHCQDGTVAGGRQLEVELGIRFGL